MYDVSYYKKYTIFKLDVLKKENKKILYVEYLKVCLNNSYLTTTVGWSVLERTVK